MVKRWPDYLKMEKDMISLEDGMHPGNEPYDMLRKRLNELGKEDLKISKTTYWKWVTERGDFPESYFYHTPPIGEAPESDRTLVTGTKAEIRDLIENGLKPQYICSASVGTFWEAFFGTDAFLDNLSKVSIPCAIVGTGYMRNYNAWGGETINVTKRLEGIAGDWRIPIEFLKSWAI